jgi:DNA-binding response OmpR family regulator
MATHSILITDHDKALSDLVSRALSRDGYEVRVAASSVAAIECAPTFRPDLLVINPAMPNLSGVEAARQICRDTKCKVLFLSALARDPDFRDMLRGLRQQGCECSALGVPFDNDELLAYVRREIGPVLILTDLDASPRPREAPRASTAVAARAPLPDYEALLRMMRPKIYSQNAFRLTSLDVDTSLRDISRQAEKLEMMAKLGVNIQDRGAFAIAVTTEEVRAALQSIKIPEQRLLHEFFWFWPTTGDSKTDEALISIKKGDVQHAEDVWTTAGVAQRELTSIAARLDSRCSDSDRRLLAQKKAELEHVAATSIHNLAVLYHLQAISLEIGPDGRGKQDNTERLSNWNKSFKFWSKLRNQHGFWEVLVDRIRSLDDPRLTVETAELIWNSLPLALLSINAQFAVAAAEARNFEAAGQQRKVMNESAFGANYVRESLHRSLRPLQEELARLCQTAETDSLQTPGNAAEIVRKLFEEKRKHLQAFNYLLGAGDRVRDTVHDLVAQTARTCLVAYANATENWAVAQPLFEECLTLSESNSLRSRLEDDLEMLAGNVAGQRAAKRTEATAAPSSSTAAQSQAPYGQQRASIAPPRKKRGLVIGAVVAVVVVIILVIVGNSDNDSSSHAPSSSQTSPVNSSDTQADRPASPSTYAAPDSAAETQDLRISIEQNQTRLKQMESEMSSWNAQIDNLKLEIETDKASLTQMERDHDLGVQVDSDIYETTRTRHNRAVETYNGLINEYNSTLPAYKRLLNSTNAQIDRYNSQARSR